MYTYNTNQPQLKLREYGRNVQKLVSQLEKIKDKSTRTKYAEAIVQVMGIVHSGDTNPNTDYLQKRWDDLCSISDYNIDIDSPYQIPLKEVLVKKPDRLPYPYSKQTFKYRRYGRHMELLIKKALETTDHAKQATIVINLANLIKNFSTTWNKDSLDVNTIMNIIQDLAGDKLIVDLDKLKSECNFNTSSNNESRERRNKTVRKKKKISA